MLVDEVQIQVTAGTGGNGAVEFTKVKMALGPVGGSGGRGGSVYLESVSDIGALAPFAHRKNLKAENGHHGRGKLTDGRDGKDLILKIPYGTRITNTETGEVYEFSKVGEQILIAEGGIGGRGNYKFRSSIQTSPRRAETGKPGQEASLHLELRLIASVGLVGLPNAGKSSLLNELTAARSKVGNYPFTTLEPSLGSYFGLIIADIPGLIEGASDGKGLGDKFLKHIERTSILFHLVSAESDDVVRDYNVIRGELKKFNPELTEKTEYVLLSHADAVSPEDLQKKTAELKKVADKVLSVSIIDDATLTEVRSILNTIKDEEGITG